MLAKSSLRDASARTQRANSAMVSLRLGEGLGMQIFVPFWALLIRLKHSLSEPIAEVQSGEVGSVGGLDRTGIGEVAGRPDVHGNWGRFRRGGWQGGARRGDARHGQAAD